MGKIYNGFAASIMAATKEKNTVKANAFKNLKAKMLEWKTSKEGAKVVNANNGEIPDSQELVIIKKYVAELMGDVELYKTAKPEMAKAAEEEASYLIPFLPAEATASDINNAIIKYVETNGDFTQKQMGLVVKFVKEQFENVDGGLIAKQIKAYLNPQV